MKQTRVPVLLEAFVPVVMGMLASSSGASHLVSDGLAFTASALVLTLYNDLASTYYL